MSPKALTYPQGVTDDIPALAKAEILESQCLSLISI
jgi:hypothetical protein